MATRPAPLPAQSEQSSGTLIVPPHPTAVVHSFAEEVILRVARQARRERVEASASKITLLSDALMGGDDDAATGIVRDARLGGMPAETLYYGLVAGAVEQVGNLWARDNIGMPDMLRASHRVWRILRDLREVFVQITERKAGQHAIFAPCPEEGHIFGLTMTADDLRRRGWEIEVLSARDHDDLIAQVERRNPLTVALGATSPEMTVSLARLVVALRAHIPGVWVMVGGAITQAQPNLLELTGADALANTADMAEQLMLSHIDEMRQRRTNRA